jgi:hypothetical protein
MHEESYNGQIEGEDVFLALMIGSVAAMLWPVVWFGRLVYIIWVKWLQGTDTNPLLKIFPPDKPVESASEKRQRIELQKREEIKTHRQHVNDRERELGLELTKW